MVDIQIGNALPISNMKFMTKPALTGGFFLTLVFVTIPYHGTLRVEGQRIPWQDAGKTSRKQYP